MGSSFERKVGDFPSKILRSNHPNFDWFGLPTAVLEVAISFYWAQLPLPRQLSCHSNHLFHIHLFIKKQIYHFLKATEQQQLSLIRKTYFKSLSRVQLEFFQNSLP